MHFCCLNIVNGSRGVIRTVPFWSLVTSTSAYLYPKRLISDSKQISFFIALLCVNLEDDIRSHFPDLDILSITAVVINM